MSKNKSKNLRGPINSIDQEVIVKLIEDEIDINKVTVVQVEEVNEKTQKTKVDKKAKNKLKWHKNKYIAGLLKSVIGLYIIGVIVGLNELLMVQLDPVLLKIHSSTFMTSKFVYWADVILGPARFMIGLLSWFVPILLVIALVIMIMSKIKWINKKDIKIFSFTLAAVLLLVI